MSDQITVLIPISPIPTHPSTEILDETVASIRERLPHAEIIFMFDGVPAWNEERRHDYNIFREEMLWKINNELQPAVPLVFTEHMHQSLMVKEAMKLVRTPLVLFSEQDTPLHNEIPFDDLIEPITSGYINVLRFHFEAQVHPEHEHLMLDQTPIDILGQPFLRTRQWSQRPHLASTKYYQHIVDTYFDDQPRFIEHIMYGIVAEGGDNYDEHRLHIYAPEGTLVRSKHLDGRRAGADHYDPTAS
jgi:hypothetical protein